MVTLKSIVKVQNIILKEKKIRMVDLLKKSKMNYNTIKEALKWLEIENKIGIRKEKKGITLYSKMVRWD